MQMRTGFLSEIGTKLRDLAVGQAGSNSYSRAALSSNDSKTLYFRLKVCGDSWDFWNKAFILSVYG